MTTALWDTIGRIVGLAVDWIRRKWAGKDKGEADESQRLAKVDAQIEVIRLEALAASATLGASGRLASLARRLRDLRAERDAILARRSVHR